jgi:hypothetical protein
MYGSLIFGIFSSLLHLFFLIHSVVVQKVETSSIIWFLIAKTTFLLTVAGGIFYLGESWSFTLTAILAIYIILFSFEGLLLFISTRRLD